jgi:hypothetical protein
MTLHFQYTISVKDNQYELYFEALGLATSYWCIGKVKIGQFPTSELAQTAAATFLSEKVYYEMYHKMYKELNAIEKKSGRFTDDDILKSLKKNLFK